MLRGETAVACASLDMQEMVSVFNSIVYAHDKQLKGAVLTLTKQQMDRIVRRNHEKFRRGRCPSSKSKRRDSGSSQQYRQGPAPVLWLLEDGWVSENDDAAEVPPTSHEQGEYFPDRK